MDFGAEISTTVEISFDGSTPVDVTGCVKASEQLRRTWGRGSSSDTADAAKVTFRLIAPRATPGMFNPADPSSPYWQPLGWLGAPVTVGVEGDAAWFTGRISGLDPGWDKDGDGYLDVEVSSDLWWLVQSRPLKCALTRAVLPDSPVAYWPCDDPAGATVFGALVGLPMPLTGSLALATTDGPAGAPGTYPQLMTEAGTGYLGGATATLVGSSESAWTVEFAVAVTQTADTASSSLAVPLSWRTSGSMTRWDVTVTKAGGQASPEGYAMVYFETEDGLTTRVRAGLISDLFDGRWHHIRVSASQTGASDIRVVIALDDDVSEGDYAGLGTIGRIQSIIIPSGHYGWTPEYVSMLSIGHLAVYDAYAPTGISDRPDAVLGWVGEQAGDRITRLAAEEGISVTVMAGDTMPMGPQTAQNIAALFRECEAADRGWLVDRDGGITYVPRAARYNTVAQLELARDDLIEAPKPSYRASGRLGQVEVSNAAGSKAVAEDTDVIDSGGTPKSATVNADSDWRLRNIAYWLLGLGRMGGARVGTLSLRLDANVSFALAAWQALTDPIRATVADVAGFVAGLDVFVEGATEAIEPEAKTWWVDLVISPAAPYTVFVAWESRRGFRATTVAAAIAAATTLYATTSAGALPTTNPAAFPYGIVIAGEEMSLTNAVQAAQDDFARTSTDGWGTATSGQTWTTVGGASTDYTVIGG